MSANSIPSSQVPALPHRVVLDEQARLEVTGVREVLRFDETQIILRTVKGLLAVQGERLKLHALAPSDGRVAAEGQIRAMTYAPDRAEGGLLRRLFG